MTAPRAHEAAPPAAESRRAAAGPWRRIARDYPALANVQCICDACRKVALGRVTYWRRKGKHAHEQQCATCVEGAAIATEDRTPPESYGMAPMEHRQAVDAVRAVIWGNQCPVAKCGACPVLSPQDWDGPYNGKLAWCPIKGGLVTRNDDAWRPHWETRMNSFEDAIRYVHNTNGGATWEIFIEDAEPVGPMLRKRIEDAGYVEVRDGYLFLTEAGEAARLALPQ